MFDTVARMVRRRGKEPEFDHTGWVEIKVEPPKRCALWTDGEWWPTSLSWWVRDTKGLWRGFVLCYGAPSSDTSSHWYPSDRIRPIHKT